MKHFLTPVDSPTAVKQFLSLPNTLKSENLVHFQGGISKLSKVLEIGNEELRHLAIKVVAVLCKGSAVRVGTEFFIGFINMKSCSVNML